MQVAVLRAQRVFTSCAESLTASLEGAADLKGKISPSGAIKPMAPTAILLSLLLGHAKTISTILRTPAGFLCEEIGPGSRLVHQLRAGL